MSSEKQVFANFPCYRDSKENHVPFCSNFARYGFTFVQITSFADVFHLVASAWRMRVMEGMPNLWSCLHPFAATHLLTRSEVGARRSVIRSPFARKSAMARKLP
jgi:hypothetical protein